MRDTPENLYLGKITPNEQDVTPGSVLADAMDRAEQCEEKLTARLEGGRRKPCCSGSSMRKMRSAAPWLWRTSSWVSGWG